MGRGWRTLAFSLVGKVFSFGSNVVRGFYAGGGKGFDLNQQPTSLSTSWMSSREGCGTPVPGSWQEDEFLGDFEQDNPHSPSITSMRPPNKRRQTDKDSWVMVGTPEEDVRSLSPKRKPSSNSVPRGSLASSRPTASRASSRRSLAPVSRRQSYHISHSGSPAQQSSQFQPPESPNRRASFAPTRALNSRPSSSNGLPTAYVSPEAERFAKRQAKHDKAADKAMSSMSRRLEDLIRQGQEALGTKFEVEGGAGDMDEGFVDEEW